MLTGYVDSSALQAVSPLAISLYNLIHTAIFVHFRYRIAINHFFALMSVSLSGSSHRLLGVDRVVCGRLCEIRNFYAQSYIR
ncbi:TPA: hypothetical protein MIZ55_12885 [Klebsiella pneumoniae]|nr:hypothetical protein [Klebsiella pneumoniae]HBX3893683.1 hypothetical protein [Klebsiella pneumoniae subsp. pneumoniae]MCQ3991902.1 hypothetical protein [Klebsiella pneumoniae]OKO66060.1 hypothetical protein BTN83_12250 [Klebsiella pneumoniae]ONG08994.1 hypothetical protein BXT92_13025 [Klebsiella pneumoniae]